MRERRLIRKRSAKKGEGHSAKSPSSLDETKEELIPSRQFIEEFLKTISAAEADELINGLKTHVSLPHDEQPLGWLRAHLEIIFNEKTAVSVFESKVHEEDSLSADDTGQVSVEEIKEENTVKRTNDSSGAGRFFENQENEATLKLLAFFEQELEDQEDKEEQKYVLELGAALAHYWPQLLAAGDADVRSELTRVQELQAILSAFLDEIKEFHHPARKRLLMFLAKQCNSYLVELEFISPEYFAKVDPIYHNVLEEAGSRIKIGYSFLVIRKANYQVVFKADVITY